MEQRERARSARKKVEVGLEAGAVPPTEFVGYQQADADAPVSLLLDDANRQLDAAGEGQQVHLFLDRTPFYAEGGGQVGDQGTIHTDTGTVRVTDTVPADGLIRGDEKRVWADAAYDTNARRARLQAAGVKARIARRPNKHHPQLPPRLKHYNRLIARHRAAVETTFATWKNRMGLTVIRYVGLTKAQAQITFAAIAFNLRRWAALTP